MNKQVCPKNFTRDYTNYLNVCLQNTEKNQNPIIDEYLFNNLWKIAELELSSLFENSTKQPLPSKDIEVKKTAYHNSILSVLWQIEIEEDFFYRHQVPDISYLHKDPRTRLKLLQEVFTPDIALQTFSREDIKKYGYDALIQKVVIDPRKITNTMLNAFGLNHFIAPSGSNQELKLSYKVQAVPYIKNFFSQNIESLEFLQGSTLSASQKKYFRLMYINDGENKGKILGTQENRGKRFFLTNIKDASRRIDNIKMSYTVEIQKLIEIQQCIVKIISIVNSYSWKDLQNTPTLFEIYTTIQSIADTLQYVRNNEKKKILHNVERCIDFTDKNQRMNPSSKMMILSPIQKLVEERINKISDIQGYIERDLVRVKAILDKQIAGIFYFCNAVRKHTDDLRIMDLRTDIEDHDWSDIKIQLDLLSNFCMQLKLYPYQGIAEKMIKEIEDIKNSFDNDPVDRTATRKSFVHIYLLAKCIEFDYNVYQISSQFFYSQETLPKINIVSLEEELQNIVTLFCNKDIASDLLVAEYVVLYEQISNYIEDVIAECKEIEELTDVEEKNKAILSVKKKISQFCIHDFFQMSFV